MRSAGGARPGMFSAESSKSVPTAGGGGGSGSGASSRACLHRPPEALASPAPVGDDGGAPFTLAPVTGTTAERGALGKLEAERRAPASPVSLPPLVAVLVGAHRWLATPFTLTPPLSLWSGVAPSNPPFSVSNCS